jgi:cystathionine beta-lyase
MNRHQATSILHNHYTPPAGFAAFPVPIHRASTVLYPDTASLNKLSWHDRSGYIYGLHGTPTTFALEARIAGIEGGKHCVLAPSGLAAISVIHLAFLSSGDDVLIPSNAYYPNQALGAWMSGKIGISVRVYDPLDLASLESALQPNTRLIWVETPGSVSMEVSDVGAISAIAHRNGTIVALDNTWSAGVAYSGFQGGADIVMQALTKYQSGGSDVLMGAAITRDEALHRHLCTAVQRLGLGVSPHDCALVHRGLDSLKLRFEAHDQAARKVASWLKTHRHVHKVLHPAFEDCPGHHVWRRDFTGAGSVFSILPAAGYGHEKVERFVDSLGLFKIGFSWGGAHSLCMPYRMNNIRKDWKEAGTLIRFYVGLEHPDDLIEDISQAFHRAEDGIMY